MAQDFNDIYFENEYAIYHIQNKLLFVQYKEIDIDLDVAIVILTDRLKFQRDVVYPVIADVHKLISVTHEARKYFATYSYELVTSVAIVSDSYYVNLLTNAYISMYKHEVPVKHFKDISKAIQWTQGLYGKKRSVFRVLI